MGTLGGAFVGSAEGQVNGASLDSFDLSTVSVFIRSRMFMLQCRADRHR